MKMKYYLRGMGVGILVTSLIFIVAFAIHKPTMSDEEVIAAAKQLGMVMEEEDTTEEDTTSAAKTTEDATGTEVSTEETTTEETQSVEDSSDTGQAADATDSVAVAFSITHGQSSSTVSENLYNQGLVDDAHAFDSYLNENGYDNYMQPGDYTIYQGSSYEDIAYIITCGKLQ